MRISKSTHQKLKNLIAAPVSYRQLGAKIGGASLDGLAGTAKCLVPIVRWLIAVDQLLDAYKGEEIKWFMPYDSEIKVEVKTTSVPPRKLGRPATAVSPKKTLLGSQSKHSISASGMSYIDSDEFIQDIKVIKGYRNIAKPLTDIFLAVEMVILNKPMGELMSWPRF